MSSDGARPRTNGYLPLEPFLHMEATDMGEVSLDLPLSAQRAGGGGWSVGARDALLLVRLHEEPLAVAYVAAAAGAAELAAAIWAQAGEAIRRHVGAHGCAVCPTVAEDLLDGFSGK